MGGGMSLGHSGKQRFALGWEQAFWGCQPPHICWGCPGDAGGHRAAAVRGGWLQRDLFTLCSLCVLLRPCVLFTLGIPRAPGSTLGWDTLGRDRGRRCPRAALGEGEGGRLELLPAQAPLRAAPSSPPRVILSPARRWICSGWIRERSLSCPKGFIGHFREGFLKLPVIYSSPRLSHAAQAFQEGFDKPEILLEQN